MYRIDAILSEIIEFIIFFILNFLTNILNFNFVYIYLIIMIILIVTLSFSILAKTKMHILFFDIIYLLLPNVSKEIIVFYYRFKEYINNNKTFFIIALFLSLISGFIFLFFILPTRSSYFMYVLFLSILIIAAILSYRLSLNQKSKIKILSKLSEDAIDIIILWSSILLLNFYKIIESIANIFALYSIQYQLVTYIITAITILLLIIIMHLYVYIVNTHRNLKNMIEWLILAFFSISLLLVYLIVYFTYFIGKGSIWYIIIGISGIIISFCIFIRLIRIGLYIHYSCNLKNINKKDWNDILSMVFTLYTLSFTILYPIIEVLGVLYIAIIFVGLTTIPLLIYCHRINKEKSV